MTHEIHSLKAHAYFDFMKKLIVPIDFSQMAQKAYGFAQKLVKKGDEIHLLHVVDMPALVSPEPFYNVSGSKATSLVDEMMVAAYDKLKDLVTTNKSEAEIKMIVDMGSPFDSIQKHITDKEADLIVMGTNGLTGIGEILIGSTTEKTVRFAKCPVIAVQENYSYSGVKKILLPTDLHDLNQNMVDKLKDLQSTFDATIEMLWVHTPHVIENEDRIRKNMQEAVKNYGLPNVNIHIKRDIFPEIGILEFADQIKADMIAMGTHGRRGISHMFVGSRAEEILNHSAIPVWAYNLNMLEK